MKSRGSKDPADRCRVPQAFWRSLEYLGLRPGLVLSRARLPATLDQNETATVTTAQLFAIWNAVDELAADPGFGFKLIEAFDTIGHQPAFLAAHYAADFRDAIFRVARFNGLGACVRFDFEERNGEFSVARHWPHATTSEPALLVDLMFAYLLELGRRGTSQDLKPIRICFARSGPKTDAQATFFRCPVRFGAASDVLVLRSVDLDRRFPSHNAEFLALLTPALAEALGELRDDVTVGEQVKAVLKRALASGRPDVAGVARDLGMSERTLQRRITDERTTFRALLVEARQELGRQLLSDGSIAIDEVAHLLGYHDTSSFYRGFKEWEGMTPSHWRAANVAGAQESRVPAEVD